MKQFEKFQQLVTRLRKPLSGYIDSDKGLCGRRFFKFQQDLKNNYRNFIFDIQTKIINLVDPSYYRICPTQDRVERSVHRFGRYMVPTKNKLFNRIVGL